MQTAQTRPAVLGRSSGSGRKAEVLSNAAEAGTGAAPKSTSVSPPYKCTQTLRLFHSHHTIRSLGKTFANRWCYRLDAIPDARPTRE